MSQTLRKQFLRACAQPHLEKEMITLLETKVKNDMTLVCDGCREAARLELINTLKQLLPYLKGDLIQNLCLEIAVHSKSIEMMDIVMKHCKTNHMQSKYHFPQLIQMTLDRAIRKDSCHFVPLLVDYGGVIHKYHIDQICARNCCQVFLFFISNQVMQNPMLYDYIAQKLSNGKCHYNILMCYTFHDTRPISIQTQHHILTEMIQHQDFDRMTKWPHPMNQQIFFDLIRHIGRINDFHSYSPLLKSVINFRINMFQIFGRQLFSTDQLVQFQSYACVWWSLDEFQFLFSLHPVPTKKLVQDCFRFGHVQTEILQFLLNHGASIQWIPQVCRPYPFPSESEYYQPCQSSQLFHMFERYLLQTSQCIKICLGEYVNKLAIQQTIQPFIQFVASQECQHKINFIRSQRFSFMRGNRITIDEYIPFHQTMMNMEEKEMKQIITLK